MNDLRELLEFEILMHTKDFGYFLYWTLLNLRMFWCLNCRYDGLHVNIFANDCGSVLSLKMCSIIKLYIFKC